jgi:hypothetical protein
MPSEGIDGFYVYTIRNQCGSPANLTIKFGSSPSPYCRTVGPHAEETYSSLDADPNWTIISC